MGTGELELLLDELELLSLLPPPQAVRNDVVANKIHVIVLIFIHFLPERYERCINEVTQWRAARRDALITHSRRCRLVHPLIFKYVTVQLRVCISTLLWRCVFGSLIFLGSDRWANLSRNSRFAERPIGADR